MLIKFYRPTVCKAHCDDFLQHKVRATEFSLSVGLNIVGRGNTCRRLTKIRLTCSFARFFAAMRKQQQQQKSFNKYRAGELSD